MGRGRGKGVGGDVSGTSEKKQKQNGTMTVHLIMWFGERVER